VHNKVIVILKNQCVIKNTKLIITAKIIIQKLMEIFLILSINDDRLTAFDPGQPG